MILPLTSAAILGLCGVAAGDSFSHAQYSGRPFGGDNATRGIGDGNTGDVCITHSATQSIIGLNSVACAGGGGAYTVQNKYYRRFTLSNFASGGINEGQGGSDTVPDPNDFTITAVEIGYELVGSEFGFGEPLELRIYDGDVTAALPDPNTALATLLYTQDDVAQVIVSTEILAQITSGGFTVELSSDSDPDNDGDGGAMFIGSNNLGETDSTFLQSADCGIGNPTPTANIGFPGMNWVLNVCAGTPPLPPCPGDANGDRSVNITDLNLVVGNFGSSCPPPQ